MKNFKIKNRLVGDSAPVFIVAEACDNHLGNMEEAKSMVRAAKRAGADAIKFQHHLPDEEMLPETPMSDNMQEPLYDFLKKYALTLDQHIFLKKYCDEIGIQYMCTPFSLVAAKELMQHNLLDVVKIGSGEMTDIPYLLEIAKFGLPIIVSTGMSEMKEIQETYEALVSTGVSFALLNCVSEYPPVYQDINLKVITHMKTEFPKAIIGHSDHTPTLYTSYAAVSLGAAIIEKHVILDKNQAGPDQSVSIDFNELSELVSGIRIIESAMGSEKKVHLKEKVIRNWAFRSIVSCKDIPKNTVLTLDHIWSKRPGTGIPSKYIPQLLGKKTTRDIPENTLLNWDDIE